ncbi:ABC-F family ATP-binding cassette domain-containing protein [Bombilactobacillus thymidiniphilus]|uniref:ABC-F family ATP-binding cassette domain-containing protein n=1 Tax=Bombilactobacillus thymidiniphilus TaxID=2923363 RepID=A0ABY4PDG0_9LACO|nr:ABC-F family ATP-binding cassette domain-containing protein [Bombilactobacillus thymidiniphilus]UQS83714.1 ABC-F family ATP-binding cassette domain-containing protein [Bombilactobacillus thymidiniphilus]
MKMLSVNKLQQSFGARTLFSDVSFKIGDQDRIGLVGLNGVGKTTLLNSLVDERLNKNKTIEHQNDYQISYLRQNPQLEEDSTVLEAILQGKEPLYETVRQYELALMHYSQDSDNPQNYQRFFKAQEQMDRLDGWEFQSTVETILTKLGITQFQQKVAALSGGQKRRVSLAQVLVSNSDLLILDEPTNHLDEEAIAWLKTFLNNYAGAVLFVTHDRYFLNAVANRILEISQQKINKYTGNYETYLQQKAQNEATLAATNRHQRNLYRHELAWVKAGVQARGTKQNARVERFKELSQKVKHQQNTESKELTIDIAQQRLGKDVFNLENSSLQFGTQVLLKNLSLRINSGEHLGIIGANGAGKSTFLNILAQRQQLTSGLLEVGQTVKVGYYTQQIEAMDANQRVFNYLEDIGQNVPNTAGVTMSASKLLEQFLFSPQQQGAFIRDLSGGEKRRLYLLAILIQQPNVLLLDEPTNNLDIETMTILENYIEHFAGAVITVSHDRYFLDKITDDLLIFHGHGHIERYWGTYSDYLQRATSQHKEVTKIKVAKQSQENSSKNKLTYAQRLELQELEPQITTLERQQQDLQNQLSNVGNDYQKLLKLQKQLNDITDELDEASERWLELAERDE